MAILVNQEPQLYAPAYNQQPWVFQDTAAVGDESNWRMVIGILRAGSLSDIIATVKARFRVGSNGQVVFDPQRIVEGDLSFDHTPMVTGWEVCSSSIMTYSIIAASQFFDAAQGRWLAKATYLSRLKYVYNGVFDPLDFVGYNYANVALFNIANTTPALTNAPTSQDIGSNESLWLHSLSAADGLAADAYVTTYSNAGAVLTNTAIANPYATWSIFVNRRRTRFAAGTRDLTTLGVSFTNVASYTVQFRNSSGVVRGATYTFTINDCAKYATTRLHWLNRLGGFDAYTFKLKSTNKRTIDRSTFGRQQNTLEGAGSYAYAKSSRGAVVFNTTQAKMLTLNAQLANDAEAVWMEDLFTSPVVFIENTDGTFTAMEPISKDYTISRGVQNGVIYVEFMLNYALTDHRQRG